VIESVIAVYDAANHMDAITVNFLSSQSLTLISQSSRSRQLVLIRH
jgi:hypothetical protein